MPLLLAVAVYATPRTPGCVRLYRSPSGPGALAWATEHAVHFRSLDMMGFPPNGLWTERQYTTEITSQLSTIFGVWDESTSGDASLLAFACCERVLDETHMLSLTVHPEYRGRGLARALVLASLAAARAAGQRLLTLEVRSSNQPAFELYRSCGMRYVGRRKKYYKSPPEDALLLTTCFDGSDLADSNAQPQQWPLSSGTAAGKSISDDEAELQLDDLVRASDAVGAIRRAAEDAAGKAPSSIDLADIGPYGTLLGQLAI